MTTQKKVHDFCMFNQKMFLYKRNHSFDRYDALIVIGSPVSQDKRKQWNIGISGVCCVNNNARFASPLVTSSEDNSCN